MLKRLYTLFIIIAMAASSTVKAEDTVYQLVKGSSASVFEDGGVYIFVDFHSKSLWVSSSYLEDMKKFSIVKISGDDDVTGYPDDITISEVNKDNCPYEYTFEKVSGDVFYIKGSDGKYLCNTRATGDAIAEIGFVNENDLSNGGISFSIKPYDEENANNYRFLLANTNKNGVMSCLAIARSGVGSSPYYFACWSGNKYVYLYKKVSSTPNPPSPNTTTFTMSNVGYATLYYGEKDVTLPEGLTASTYTLRNTQDATYLTPSHTYVAGDKIPAGTAVVVKGNEGNYNLTLSEKDNTLTEYDNVLQGCDEETTLTADANKYFYKLTLNSEGDPNSVGFYWAEEDGAAFTTQAHKAYLAISKSAAAKSIVTFLDSDNQNTTGLVEIKANVKADAIYDLSGKQASKSGKGVKIEKGKKYLMR